MDMEGWKEEWMAGWVSEQMDGWMGGWVDGWMDECMQPGGESDHCLTYLLLQG